MYVNCIPEQQFAIISHPWLKALVGFNVLHSPRESLSHSEHERGKIVGFI